MNCCFRNHFYKILYCSINYVGYVQNITLDSSQTKYGDYPWRRKKFDSQSDEKGLTTRYDRMRELLSYLHIPKTTSTLCRYEANIVNKILSQVV